MSDAGDIFLVHILFGLPILLALSYLRARIFARLKGKVTYGLTSPVSSEEIIGAWSVGMMWLIWKSGEHEPIWLISIYIFVVLILSLGTIYVSRRFIWKRWIRPYIQ